MPFTAIADGFQQAGRSSSETLVGRRVITLNRNNMRRGFPGMRSHSPFSVFDIQRLRHFRSGVMLDRQGHRRFLYRGGPRTLLQKFLRDTFMDLPVALRFPGWINGGRQRVNKRMHIRVFMSSFSYQVAVGGTMSE